MRFADVVCAREPLNERHQQLTVDLPANPLFVAVRLAQVFSNLLQNACKYTQPGGAIAVRAERVAKSVVIRVIDNGIRIPAEMLAPTERFRCAAAARTPLASAPSPCR